MVRQRRAPIVLAVTLLVCGARSTLAGPITFLTALPVAKSQAVIRGQYLLIRASGDPTPADRSLTVNGVPFAAAVGLSSRLAVFGILPILDKSIQVNAPIGRVTRDAAGLSDVVAFARYTVYALDAADYTFRIAPFGGLKLPTGDADEVDALGRLPRPLQLGSGSWDGLGGLAVAWQTKVWELDADVFFKKNTEADAYNYQLHWFDLDGQPLNRVGYHLFWLWPRPATSPAGFFVPTDAAEGPAGIIHVADSGNHQVVMLSATGERLGHWEVPDPNPDIYSPEHVAVSPDGHTVYATDLGRNRVLVLEVRSR